MVNLYNLMVSLPCPSIALNPLSLFKVASWIETNPHSRPLYLRSCIRFTSLARSRWWTLPNRKSSRNPPTSTRTKTTPSSSYSLFSRSYQTQRLILYQLEFDPTFTLAPPFDALNRRWTFILLNLSKFISRSISNSRTFHLNHHDNHEYQ